MSSRNLSKAKFVMLISALLIDFQDFVQLLGTFY